MAPEDAEKAARSVLRFRAFIACGWGLVILFGTMGVLLGKPAGVYVAIIASLTWVQVRVLQEALAGLTVLRSLKDNVKDGQPGSKGDDDKLDPPGPTAST